MYILGIHNAIDSGVALFKDGECIFAINEERLSRIKMDDALPKHSLEAALQFAGITLSDIDVISYAWHHRFPYEDHLLPYVERAIAIAEEGPESKRIMLERIKVEVERSVPRRQAFEDWMEELGQTKKIEWFDHHLGHAATAYYPSPYNEALIFTLDALGNFKSGLVGIGRGDTIEEISCNYSWDSLGFYYGQITELLGFRYHRHEGKVTGLAAYGDPSKCLQVMREMVTVKDGKLYGKIGKYYKPFFLQQHQALLDALKPFSREDIAAAAQKHLEEVVVEYIRFYVDKYAIGNIALAGGVFGNVKLNQRIREIPGVKDIFVFPHMGDGGLAVGAAALSSVKHGFPRYRIKSPYLGNESTNSEVEKLLTVYSDRINFEQFETPELVKKIIALIGQNKVVGLFQGRMEFGPRALGNRTIIYHATDKTVNDWLNKRMHRTEFMPFAPVTTTQLAPRCFALWQPDHITTRFMTECYNCTEEMKSNSPAVVHVDGTARPQIISRPDNPFYFDIVDGWHKATGGLCLINTSFNEHEHPIVGSPTDALESLLADNVDYVVINERYLVSSKKLKN